MKNFYEVLRVKTNASPTQIKKAYIQLITKYHPDIFPGDKRYAERYTAVVTEAYFVLKNDEKRKEYDILHSINVKKHAKDKTNRFCECNEVHVSSQRETSEYLKNRKRKRNPFSFFARVFKSKVFLALIIIVAISLSVATLLYWK